MNVLAAIDESDRELPQNATFGVAPQEIAQAASAGQLIAAAVPGGKASGSTSTMAPTEVAITNFRFAEIGLL